MAESKRDYYEVLGVPKDADDATLKKAYRTLAKKYHPDANPGDQAAADKFKEASEAYSLFWNVTNSNGTKLLTIACTMYPTKQAYMVLLNDGLIPFLL